MMTKQVVDPYTGTSNGARVQFVMEWIWRVATVIVLPVVAYLLVQLASIEASLAEIRVHDAQLGGRILSLEQRTASMPPTDYKAYIDEKFEHINDRLDELTTDLKAHMRGNP